MSREIVIRSRRIAQHRIDEKIIFICFVEEETSSLISKKQTYSDVDKTLFSLKVLERGFRFKFYVFDILIKYTSLVLKSLSRITR